MTDVTPPAAEPIADDEACAAAIAAIGALEQRLAAIEAEKSKAVAAAAVSAEDAATPLLDEKAALAAKVEAYCAAHRVRLTANHQTKTVAFPTGEISWTLSRGKVVIDPTLKAKILEKLKSTAKAFVRTREEIDMAAIGKAFREKSPAAAKLKGIRGLKFEKGAEVFSVKPAGAELVERPPMPAEAAA